MAALVATAISQRFVQGNLVTRFFNLAGNNGDTFTFPGIGPPLLVDASPTTAIAIGTTIAGSVITFITAGAWTALVQITSRYG